MTQLASASEQKSFQIQRITVQTGRSDGENGRQSATGAREARREDSAAHRVPRIQPRIHATTWHQPRDHHQHSFHRWRPYGRGSTSRHRSSPSTLNPK